MHSEPEDDLDITAELPQLEWQEGEFEDTALHMDDDSVRLPQRPTRAKASPRHSNPDDTATTQNWQALDELISVREKIADLEASLMDAELKLAKLDKQHQELQTRHAELTVHNAELATDRERIVAERNLLMESHQQLKSLFQRSEAEALAHAAALQEQLRQQQQQAATLQAELTQQHDRAQASIVTHQQRLQEQAEALHEEQTQVRTLGDALRDSQLAREKQEAAAGLLAGNLAHELLAKQSLQATLEQRDLRIRALEHAQQQLQTELADTHELHQTALTQIEQLQSTAAAQSRQIIELQAALASSEQRAAHISEQLEAEHGRVRSSEQDQERLTRLAAAEHASYESARQELAGRLTELKALQEQLLQARNAQSALEAQLAERDLALQSRDELLAAKQQTLQLATEGQAAAAQREAALTESLALLQENFRQMQVTLQERSHELQNLESRLTTETATTQQVQAQLAALQPELAQVHRQKHERDQFILDQAAELQQALLQAERLATQLTTEQAANKSQQARIQALEADQLQLRNEFTEQARLLAQKQQELDARSEQQGASAKQVEALQRELHNHVEALNAIRRDIHQVAQHSRNREPEVQVRTLTRVDDNSVVHLLNKPVMVIGRANEAEICIQADSISRRHACLRVARDVVIVEDLGSTNGCYVNGKRIKRQLLKDGDRLEIGAVAFRFTARATQS